MNWKTWLSLLLIASSASWMTFDGARALILGDYVTPQTGEYAGQLGPWANLVQTIGIEPRSTLMKLIFVIQGIATMTIIVCYILYKPWARTALLAAMLLGLWYLPIGTLVNLVALILLLLTRRKAMPPRPRHEMPDFIHEALHKHGLMEAYLARPPYQRNDYIGWITRARLTPTRQKRLKQMLGELKKGDVYMNMEWRKSHIPEIDLSPKA
ncbi:MAG TPA: YdeI/OmpD-associated family protein [Anaerolineales bacterium]|nr:YdeI/OmpD-associated family protein [Anaerolineales bacterium]